MFHVQQDMKVPLFESLSFIQNVLRAHLVIKGSESSKHITRVTMMIQENNSLHQMMTASNDHAKQRLEEILIVIRCH